MKPSRLFFIGILFFLTGCQREDTQANQDCHITKVSLDGTHTIDIAYNAQGKITQVVYPAAPEFSYNISYGTNQQITETDITSSAYTKKLYTYDATGKVVNIKSFYEYNNPTVNEEIRFTYNGNELIADTTYQAGTISQVTAYTWQNGNVIQLVVNGSRIIHRGYDLTKTPAEGDAAWAFTYLENVGYYPSTTNLMTYEYEEGMGNPASSSFNYTFDGTGKITGFDMGFTGQLSFTHQCN